MEQCQPVLLEPFMHQVSGHSHMFVYDSNTVCKPMCEREYDFYSSLPKKLLPFTPKFKGVIEVDAREDRDGDITLVGLPECLRKLHAGQKLTESGSSPGSSGEGGNDSDSDSGSSPGTAAAAACCQQSTMETAARSRKKHTEEQEGSKVSKGSSIMKGGEKKKTSITGTLFENHGTGGKVKPVSAGTRNPWSIRCHSIRLDEIRRADKRYKGRKFILLENVVSQFHRPCVLDLKMGTRQYGDEETDEKRERKNRRCMTTTSAKLGIRMCGMQVYQVRSRKFICRDKYFGRKVTEDGLRDVLYQFLHNGARLRPELIDETISKLQNLHSLVLKQNTFRFYSSSLLIMYDGSSSESYSSDHTDNSVTCTSVTKGGKQATSTSVTKGGNQDWSVRLPASELDRVHRTSSAGSDDNRDIDYKHVELNATCEKNVCTRKTVDVRMIDFAHTTGQGMSQINTKHYGPDTGYLIGLENLIKMFGDIKIQEQGQQVQEPLPPPPQPPPPQQQQQS